MRVDLKNHRKAFTLIEVNLAILLIATGVLVLLALFPLGLKESEEGIMDTHEGMFAGHVLSGMEGNALSMTNWSDWANMDDFQQKIDNGIDAIQSGQWRTGQVVTEDPWPQNGTRAIRYQLTVIPDGGSDNRAYTATLRVKSGKYGVFDDMAHYYVTKFAYMGM
jgi:competence protein ComGC